MRLSALLARAPPPLRARLGRWAHSLGAPRANRKGDNFFIPHFNPRRLPKPQSLPAAGVREEAEAVPTERPWRRHAPALIDLPAALEAGLQAGALARLRETARSVRRERSLAEKRARKARQQGKLVNHDAAHAIRTNGDMSMDKDGAGSPSDTADEDPSVDEFAAHRMHGAYAGAYRMLWEARARLPATFVPRSTLEFGAGLAPVAWAATTLWPEGAAMMRHTAVEPNAELRLAGAELCSAVPDASAMQLADGSNNPTGWDETEHEGKAGGDTQAMGAPNIDWVAHLPQLPDTYDLVSAPYSLESLPADSLQLAVRALWARVRKGGILAVALPATRSGFAKMLLTREELLGRSGAGATRGEERAGPPCTDAMLVAPCPHVHGCPMRPGSALLPWHAKRGDRVPPSCHVEQKVVESSASAFLHRAQRRGDSRSHFLERMCYIVVRKSGADEAIGNEPGQHSPDSEQPQSPRVDARAHSESSPAAWARVIRPPRIRAKHVHLDLCTADGEVVACTLTKRKQDRVAYRTARKLQVGSSWEWGVHDAGAWGGAARDAPPSEEDWEEYYYEGEEEE